MRVYASIKEITEILAAYTAATATGQQTALATVVHVEGSSYRKPGARMLITSDGVLTGGISGGCLEGDALRKALFVIQQQTPTLVTYDTMDDEEGLGAALGCNGIIKVLIEPINADSPTNPIVFLEKIVAQRSPSVLLTLFSDLEKKSLQPGTCALLQDGHLEAGVSFPNNISKSTLDQWLTQSAQNQRSSFETLDTFTGFIEYVPPPIHLIIAGDGNDIVPLIAFADILGWSISLLDGHRSYLSKMKNLPPNCRVIRSNDAVFKTINLDKRTALVAMSHNFHNDKAIVKAAFETYPLPYIGLLGPRKKRQRLIDELTEEGMVLETHQLDTLHGPTGLEIGSNTPESIALSIVAQIQQILR